MGSQTQGKLAVISGPSGVGKSTLTRRVLDATGARYSVSATTRPPRQGEVDGRDYHFVDEAEFRRMIDNGELLEWAEVFGNYYGTPAGPVDAALSAGQTVILEIDVQGGIQVARRRPDAAYILVVPPNDRELERRLRGRGTDSDEVIARRLAKAKAEIEAARASGVYTYEIVNDRLDRAVQETLVIIAKESTQA